MIIIDENGPRTSNQFPAHYQATFFPTIPQHARRYPRVEYELSYQIHHCHQCVSESNRFVGIHFSRLPNPDGGRGMVLGV